MKKFVRGLFLILAISIVALSFGCPTTTTTSPTAPAKIIRLTFCTTTLPWKAQYEQWEWVAERIPEATGGRVRLDYYPSGSLFESGEILNALISGAADLTPTSTVMIQSVMPVLAVTRNIMMFENPAHVKALWESEIGAELLGKLEKERGIKTVALLPDATSGGNTLLYNSVRQITKLEDLKGLKIRVPSDKQMVDAMAKLGVSVISIPEAEALTALQQHMIHGLLTSWSSVTVFSLNVVTPYCLDESMGASGQSIFCANLKSWNRLPPDVQKIITDVVAKELNEAFDVPKLLSVPTDKGKALYQSDPGTKTNILSAEERARWRALLKPLWQESAAPFGDLGQRILAKIEELRPQFARK